MNMKLAEFGMPQIKLIDETALMLFEMKGRAGDGAKKGGRAHRRV